ncbi:MAG: Outer membrane protein TolC [Verrucomicrobia bacterium]|nr:MAG: Outer membrane protein TolC [Verrucomicrobiota bacterium]
MKPHPLVFNSLLLCFFTHPCTAAPALPKVAPAESDTVAKETQTAGTSGRRRQLDGKVELADAVNLALRQNPEVLGALREIERKYGRVIEVRAQALPHIALNPSFREQDKKLLSQGLAANLTQNKSWSIALEVRQVLYAGGSVAASLRSAKFSQEAAYYGLRDTLDRVVSQVRQQFSQVLATKALIEVAEESVELANQQLKDATNRFQAGTVPRFNVLRAEVEVASVKPGLIRAKNDNLIAQLQLAKTLGLDASPSGKPTFQCVGDLQVSSRPMGLSDSLSLAKARRPMLKSKRQEILVEKENVTIALAGYKPRLEASAGYELVNKSTSRKLDDTVNGYFLGVTGSWKIFDSFETSGLVAQAKSQMQKAVISYDDALQTVELEVQRAYADLQQYRETIESQQQNVKQAVEALRLAQERLSAGAGTQLEVLDARVALTRARTTELQARAEYVRSLAEYDRVTATDTVYSESFQDPLSQLEKKVLRFKPVDLFKP